MSFTNNHQNLMHAKEKFENDHSLLKKISMTMNFLGSSSFSSSPIINIDQRAIVFDLSKGANIHNVPIKGLKIDEFSRLVEDAMYSENTGYGFGRWAEVREIYANEFFNSTVEGSNEKRDVHLGVDVFCQSGEDIFTPLDGRIHIKSNNKNELDYGPMLILEHSNDNDELFYTLYGHLSLASIANIEEGQSVVAGQKIAEVGAPPENGNWPPHLHFQLILELFSLGSDFPGVALSSEQEMWLALSPCPIMFFSDAYQSINSIHVNAP